MLRRLLFLSLSASFVALALATPGCSDQGEGDRCSHLDDNNGNDDCASGLTCYLGSTLNGSPAYDVCCPTNQAQATTAICALTPSPPSSDASLPIEGGGTTTGDAGSDSSTGSPDSASDAPVDSQVDALADAPVDAPVDSPVDSSADTSPPDDASDSG